MPSPDKKKYTCIIVDDNELDRLALQSYLRRYEFIEVVGAFESAVSALEFVQLAGTPNALFLDIDMPGMNGLDLRQELRNVPACIFVTSHPEYALDGFEMAALDYIVKPLRAERFQEVMKRLEEYLELHFKAKLLDYTLGENTVMIKDGYNHIKLQMQEIIYLEALKDYTGIVTKARKYCVLAPLGGLLKEKAFQQFVRIHRRYAIHKNSAREISFKSVRVDQILLPVGRSYKETIEKLLST